MAVAEMFAIDATSEFAIMAQILSSVVAIVKLVPKIEAAVCSGRSIQPTLAVGPAAIQ